MTVTGSLEEARDHIHDRQHDAHSRLRTWRWVYYVIGLTSVAAAAVAGFAGLADLVSVQVAGGIALGSAVLGAADKFLGAGGKVEKIAAECGSLDDEDMWLDTTIKDGQDKQDEIRALEDEIQKASGISEAQVLQKKRDKRIAEREQWRQRELSAVKDYIDKHPNAA
jgi:hypothetical protein